MKTFSSVLLCFFILLQMFYLIQLGARLDPYVDLGFELHDEETLDKTIDDSNDDDSNQELTSESKSYGNIDKKSRVGRCSI